MFIHARTKDVEIENIIFGWQLHANIKHTYTHTTLASEIQFSDHAPAIRFKPTKSYWYLFICIYFYFIIVVCFMCTKRPKVIYMFTCVWRVWLWKWVEIGSNGRLIAIQFRCTQYVAVEFSYLKKNNILQRYIEF